jgi:site-specific recombinase XerD
MTIEQVKAVRDVQLEDRMQIIARDIFMIIFYLGGVNFVDLVHLNKPIDNRIIYNRRKTSETKSNDIPISLKIQPELEELLLKYKGEEFAFDFGYKFIDYRDFRRLINRWIKKVAEKSNININLTTYQRRHSWATIADELGVDTNVIEYVLGQSSKGRVAFQYMHRRHKAAERL